MYSKIISHVRNPVDKNFSQPTMVNIRHFANHGFLGQHFIGLTQSKTMFKQKLVLQHVTFLAKEKIYRLNSGGIAGTSQTKFLGLVQRLSLRGGCQLVPMRAQSSPPQQLLGWSNAQISLSTGLPVTHRHTPSSATSLAPTQNVISGPWRLWSSSCKTNTLSGDARSPPIAWHSRRAAFQLKRRCTTSWKQLSPIWKNPSKHLDSFGLTMTLALQRAVARRRQTTWWQEPILTKQSSSRATENKPSSGVLV